MTINELIKQLSEVENKEMEVVISWSSMQFCYQDVAKAFVCKEDVFVIEAFRSNY